MANNIIQVILDYHTGGVLGVELYKAGESQQERLDALEAANDDIVLMIAI